MSSAAEEAKSQQTDAVFLTTCQGLKKSGKESTVVIVSPEDAVVANEASMACALFSELVTFRKKENVLEQLLTTEGKVMKLYDVTGDISLSKPI